MSTECRYTYSWRKHAQEVFDARCPPGDACAPMHNLLTGELLATREEALDHLCDIRARFMDAHPRDWSYRIADLVDALSTDACGTNARGKLWAWIDENRRKPVSTH